MSALSNQLPRSRSPQTGTNCHGQRTLNLPPTLQIAGKLGFTGVLTGFSLLILGCAGFNAAMAFSPAIIALGLSSLILTITARKQAPNSSILASGFSSIFAILGGAIELAIWIHE